MAEFQKQRVASSGEMAQRFIEFVLMHAQNAAFMLGQIPHPQTGQPEVNLPMAQILIDQLAMLQEKTQGNLNADESRILAGTISNLQMAYVEAARRGGGGAPAEVHEEEQPASTVSPPSGQAEPQTPATAPVTSPEGESRKKFVKSYGS
jgi:Domain of unknown function (DUF1844)